jgi:hypothetical protein
MRRHHALLVALALALALGAWRGTPPAAPAGTPAPAASAGFIGSWQLLSRTAGQPPAPALLTLGADGTLLGAGLPVQPAGPGVVFLSPGHGAWRPTGAGTAEATLVLLVADAQGTFRGTETDRIALRLGPDGRTWRGSFRATVTDPTGRVENGLDGTVEGTRIVAGPGGTPTA